MITLEGLIKTFCYWEVTEFTVEKYDKEKHGYIAGKGLDNPEYIAFGRCNVYENGQWVQKIFQFIPPKLPETDEEKIDMAKDCIKAIHTMTISKAYLEWDAIRMAKKDSRIVMPGGEAWNVLNGK